MHRRYWIVGRRGLLAATLVVALPAVTQLAAQDTPRIGFVKTQIDDKFRSEGAAIGDFNKDGRPDIAAGFVWYEAPDWKLHSLLDKAPEYDPVSYSNSFGTFAWDVNGDTWLDILVVDFPGTPTWWFENPGPAGQLWKRHELTPVTNNESPLFTDVDADGKAELVAAFAPNPAEPDAADRQLAFMTPQADPYEKWKINVVSAKGAPGTAKYAHGLGVGDVNLDGRNDILCSDGWWEAPAAAGASAWAFHAVPFGEAAHMGVDDFDGDKDADVLSSSPHAYGIWWHEQLPDGKWAKHEIDRTFSQTHAVCFADLNGDGLMDFVTGKRWWAHHLGDPGSSEPAVLCWFELQRQNGRPVWTRHVIDDASGVGTQFDVNDLNGDGLPDIAVSNKRGVFCFVQTRE
ncbi:MAG: hypothetical protein A2W31_12995 [Planctomycetes bacterium RBG_16_64_10]|nr:MAG: hypothetical protein A2W31_12995 [Planctomycetes bacterium RBG_16_64_10]